MELKDLKVGDEVAYFTSARDNTPRIETITRETKTLFFLSFAKKCEVGTFEAGFSKRDGHAPGSHSLDSGHISVLTEALRVLANSARTRRKMEDCIRRLSELCPELPDSLLGSAYSELEAFTTRTEKSFSLHNEVPKITAKGRFKWVLFRLACGFLTVMLGLSLFLLGSVLLDIVRKVAANHIHLLWATCAALGTFLVGCVVAEIMEEMRRDDN